MASYDPEKAAKVWQRVQGQTPGTLAPSHLMPMIVQEQSASVSFLHLSRHFAGKDGALLRQLAQECQADAACLRGICALLTGKRPSPKAAPAPQGATATELRRCYGQTLQAQMQYKALSSDPEYGSVFSRLAARKEDQSLSILRVLGQG